MPSQLNPSVFRTRITSILVPVLLIGWLAAVGFGFYSLTMYDLRPGVKGDAPSVLPRNSKVFHTKDKPTLVLFAHPHCPCTRATVAELEKIMARGQNHVNATVVFLKPPNFSDEWTRSDLWSTASRIPGVKVMADQDGAEAKLFGCATSGHTLGYDASGRLLFSGGITASRGHQGDNDGMEAVIALLRGEKQVRSQTAVYGCPLVDGPERDDPLAFLKERCEAKN